MQTARKGKFRYGRLIVKSVCSDACDPLGERHTLCAPLRQPVFFSCVADTCAGQCERIDRASAYFYDQLSGHGNIFQCTTFAVETEGVFTNGLHTVGNDERHDTRTLCEGIFADCLHTVREYERCKTGAVIKRMLADRPQLAAGGKAQRTHSGAMAESVFPDLRHRVGNGDGGERGVIVNVLPAIQTGKSILRNAGDRHAVDLRRDEHVADGAVRAGDDTGLRIVVDFAAAVRERVAADGIGDCHFFLSDDLFAVVRRGDQRYGTGGNAAQRIDINVGIVIASVIFDRCPSVAVLD